MLPINYHVDYIGCSYTSYKIYYTIGFFYYNNTCNIRGNETADKASKKIAQTNQEKNQI